MNPHPGTHAMARDFRSSERNFDVVLGTRYCMSSSAAGQSGTKQAGVDRDVPDFSSKESTSDLSYRGLSGMKTGKATNTCCDLNERWLCLVLSSKVRPAFLPQRRDSETVCVVEY